MIVLGQRVRCKVTGFQGIVVARTTYLFASTQVWIQPEKVNDTGNPAERIWMEETQVTSLSDAALVPNYEMEEK